MFKVVAHFEEIGVVLVFLSRYDVLIYPSLYVLNPPCLYVALISPSWHVVLIPPRLYVVLISPSVYVSKIPPSLYIVFIPPSLYVVFITPILYVVYFSKLVTSHCHEPSISCIICALFLLCLLTVVAECMHLLLNPAVFGIQLKAWHCLFACSHKLMLASVYAVLFGGGGDDCCHHHHLVLLFKEVIVVSQLWVCGQLALQILVYCSVVCCLKSENGALNFLYCLGDQYLALIR